MTAGMNAHGVIPVTPTEEEETVAATPAVVTVAADATNMIRDANTAVIAVAATRGALMPTQWSQNAAAPGHVTKHAQGLRRQGTALQGAAQRAALAGSAAPLSAQRDL